MVGEVGREEVVGFGEVDDGCCFCSSVIFLEDIKEVGGGGNHM